MKSNKHSGATLLRYHQLTTNHRSIIHSSKNMKHASSGLEPLILWLIQLHSYWMQSRSLTSISEPVLMLSRDTAASSGRLNFWLQSHSMTHIHSSYRFVVSPSLNSHHLTHKHLHPPRAQAAPCHRLHGVSARALCFSCETFWPPFTSSVPAVWLPWPPKSSRPVLCSTCVFVRRVVNTRVCVFSLGILGSFLFPHGALSQSDSQSAWHCTALLTGNACC